MLNIIAYLIKAIVEGISIGMICENIFSAERKSTKRFYLAVILYSACTIIQLMTFYGVVTNIATGIIMLALLTFTYRMKHGYRILAAIISYVIASCCEAIVWLPIRYITGLEGTEISPRLWYYPLTTLATAATGLLAIWGLCWFVKRLRRNAAALYGVVLVIVCVLCGT